MMTAQSTILLAMSGGIDSTAAALLLQEQGYRLVGCTFRTRYTDDASVQSAVALAQRLDIEHHVLDYDARFQEEVVRYFGQEYTAGRTPNPCVVCNRQIKFGALMEEADRLGCDGLATGHYAQVREGELYRAKDIHKDQTYFLWQVPQQTLKRVLFPLGNFTKEDIRIYLESKGLTELAHKTESQDICFIHDDYRSFLQAHAPSLGVPPATQGDYINAEGKVLGRHEGYVNYTIGQRKGLGIALGTPAFVTQIDAKHNRVTLGSHDDLYTRMVPLSRCLFRGDASRPVMAQIRYRSLPQEARVELQDETQALVHFTDAVWAPTPGQSCVFYQDNRVIGGGIIES